RNTSACMAEAWCSSLNAMALDALRVLTMRVLTRRCGLRASMAAWVHSRLWSSGDVVAILDTRSAKLTRVPWSADMYETHTFEWYGAEAARLRQKANEA